MKQGIQFPGRGLILAGATAAMVMTGCANMTETQRNTAIGAGVGAVAGGLIGDGKGAAIGAAVGAAGGYAWSKYMENKKTQMQQATAGTGVEVTQTQDNRLKLNIPSDVSFDTGRSDIKGNFAPVLDRFAASLRANQSTDVRIVGHTDNTGSDAINNPLSMDRAASTRNYLTSRGISGSRIQVEGRGSYEPIASNNTSDGRSRNRRVEIFVGERPR